MEDIEKRPYSSSKKSNEKCLNNFDNFESQKNSINSNQTVVKKNVFIIMADNNAKLNSNKNNNNHQLASTSNMQDLTLCFRNFLRFGRIICIIPVRGLCTGRVESLQFRWKSFEAIISIIITILLAFCSVIGVIGFFKQQKVNTNQLAWSAHLAVFYATGFFIYLYFLLYSADFIALLKKWKYTTLHNEMHDKKLIRNVNWIAGFILISIILENISWHFKHFTGYFEDEELSNSTRSPDKSPLENFYDNSEPEWTRVFPYHPAIAIFVIVTNKWAIYSWNWFDILIILMSRALTYKFKTLNLRADEFLADPCKELSKWKEFLVDHLVLSDLLSSCDEFLSPIIFVSYCVNIYNVCIHLSLGLSPAWNASTIGTIYAIWAFAQLTIRLYMVSIYAAKLHEHARNICRVLKNCPIELYDKETEKFERQVTHDIGFTGLGYFTISKAFMLRMLGVVFTVEIVLLQNPPSNPS